MRKVKLGLVGLNFGLRFVAEQLRPGGAAEPHFELAAVCDINEQLTSQVSKTHKVPGYSSVGALLEDGSVEAVALFTGPVGRAAIIRQIIRSGKDVITTKPLELDPAEALSVLEEASQLGRTVHLNSPSPLPSKDIAQIMAWQRSFSLGRPVAAHWQTWCSYREDKNGTWYDDPELCPVAPIFRLGIYAINDLLWFLRDPESVQVMHSRLFTKRPTPDNAQMLIRFKDGTLASVSASFCVAGGMPYPDSLILNFERGTVYRGLGLAHNGFAQTTQLRLVTGAPENIIEESMVLDRASCSGMYMWDEFFKAVRGQRNAQEISARQITDGIRIIDAMKHAQNTGMAAEIKPIRPLSPLPI